MGFSDFGLNISLAKLLFLLNPPKFYKNPVSWIWRKLFKLARSKWKLTWICVTPGILRCIRCYVDLSSNSRGLLNFSYFKIRKQSPLSWNLTQLSFWVDNYHNQMAMSTFICLESQSQNLACLFLTINSVLPVNSCLYLELIEVSKAKIYFQLVVHAQR